MEKSEINLEEMLNKIGKEVKKKRDEILKEKENKDTSVDFYKFPVGISEPEIIKQVAEIIIEKCGWNSNN